MRVGAIATAAAVVLLIPAWAQAQGGPKLVRTEVIVIADLSNRIDARLHPGQVDRDTAIVRLIADEFGGLVRRNRFLFSRDRLRMMYIGGQNAPVEPRVDVAKMNEEHRIVVKELPAALASFRVFAVQPYLPKRTAYNGADLWSWFHNTAPKVLKVDDPHRETRTRIIILTDGYLEFAPSIRREPGTTMRMTSLRGRQNWEDAYTRLKLKSAGVQLQNTKVLVLELAPLRPEVYTTEQEIIERYWRDWFQGMGAETAFLSSSEALPAVGDAIRQFVSH
jgi:hypothetical protein